MARILDPANTADNAGYEAIRTLLDVDTSNADIDADPIFRLSEDEIIARLPDAENRNYAHRATIVNSGLPFCAVANFLEGGGSSTVFSEATAGGDLKSVRIGLVSKTYTEGSTRNRSGAQTDPSERSAFFRAKCDEILKELGASETDDDLFTVLISQ